MASAIELPAVEADLRPSHSPVALANAGAHSPSDQRRTGAAHQKVAEDGRDIYTVEHEHALAKWVIQVELSGKIADANFVNLAK